jgi:glycosyltransferase involved in cell wall biosynthesis
VNVAGGPGALAAGMRDLGMRSTMLVFNDHRFGLGYDRNLHLREGGGRRDLAYNLPRQFRALAWAMPRFDIFHFHFAHTLVPKKVNLPLLRAARKGIVFQFWGSDVRDKGPEAVEFLRRADVGILGSFATLGRAPNLPRGIRWPHWEVLPPAIDLSDWTAVPPDAAEAGEPVRPLRVVHAPSKRAVKGTEAVIAAVAEARGKGAAIELDLVEDVPHAEARARYEAADVIVDQLLIGWYGLFSIESMALGKPVICHVDRAAARRTGEAFGHDVPIIDATPDTLARVLGELAGDRGRLAQLGRASRSYVETVHERGAVVRHLLGIYARAGVPHAPSTAQLRELAATRG